MTELTKIVLTGPESTGKSMLGMALAEHYGLKCVPEFARYYLEKNGKEYNFNQLLEIARGHKVFQRQAVEDYKGSIIFYDTDLINFHIWTKLVFHQSHKWIDEEMEKEQDHLYLLLYPDIPWTHDPLRENPNNRHHIYDHHLRTIANLKRKYRVIKGNGDIRIRNAIKAVDEMLSLKGFKKQKS